MDSEINNPDNARSGWEYYLGEALQKINKEMRDKGRKEWSMGRLLKRVKGLNEAKLRDLHFECEKAEKKGIPYGKVFFAKTKQILGVVY